MKPATRGEEIACSDILPLDDEATHRLRTCRYWRPRRLLAAEIDAAIAEAVEAERKKWEALYAKAWEECGTWRYANGAKTEAGWTSTRYAGDGKYYADYPNHAADAHDAARREAGL